MAEIDRDFIVVSYELDEAGLLWLPEIGDEVVTRGEGPKISILVDPQGMTPGELRESFVWMPTVEQLVVQIEAHQGLLFHAGTNQSLKYEAVIKTATGIVEASAATLRTAFGKALNLLLTKAVPTPHFSH